MSDNPAQAPVPLKTFVASLRPQKIGSRTITPRRRGVSGPPQVVDIFGPGSPQEIWAKLLEINHGNERHTMDEWHKLIEDYGNQPAHPADPHFVKGS